MTPEELKTKPWFIKINNEEHSNQVQKLLFAAGIFWYSSDKNSHEAQFLWAGVLTNKTTEGNIPGYIVWSSDEDLSKYGCEEIVLNEHGALQRVVDLTKDDWKILVEGSQKEKLIQAWLAERGLHFDSFIERSLGRYWLIKNGSSPLYWNAYSAHVDLPEIKFNFKLDIESVDIPELKTPKQKELEKLLKQREDLDAYAFNTATHPMETLMWHLACEAQLFLTGTDVPQWISEEEYDEQC